MNRKSDQTTIDWTPEKIAELTRLHGEGHPYSEIGRRMHITKNAAMAKIGRLGLNTRGRPIKPTIPDDQKKIPRGSKITLPPLPSLKGQ